MWALECLKVKLPRNRHTVAPTHFQKWVWEPGYLSSCWQKVDLPKHRMTSNGLACPLACPSLPLCASTPHHPHRLCERSSAAVLHRQTLALLGSCAVVPPSPRVVSPSPRVVPPSPRSIVTSRPSTVPLDAPTHHKALSAACQPVQ